MQVLRCDFFEKKTRMLSNYILQAIHLGQCVFVSTFWKKFESLRAIIYFLKTVQKCGTFVKELVQIGNILFRCGILVLYTLKTQFIMSGNVRQKQIVENGLCLCGAYSFFLTAS